MAEHERKSADGRALWQRVRATRGRSSESADLDSLDLAAYLEGRLEGEARADFEAKLAASPDSLDLLVAAHDAIDAGSFAAPDSLVRRASDLAAAPEIAGVDPGGGRRAWLADQLSPAFLIRRAPVFASLLAIFLLAGAAGFELGRAEVAYSAQIDGLLAQEIDFAIERTSEDML